MSCCVDRCSTGLPLVRFPRDYRLQARWRELIERGSGTHLDTLGEKEYEICLHHFSKQDDFSYQEPSRFINQNGKLVVIVCCRMCLRYDTEANMFCIEDVLSGQKIRFILQNILKIRVKHDDFLQHVCNNCLVKLDIVSTIYRQCMMQDSVVHSLQHKTNLLELAPETIKQDDDEEYIIEELVLEETVLDENVSEEHTDTKQQHESVDDIDENAGISSPKQAKLDNIPKKKRKYKVRDKTNVSREYIRKPVLLRAVTARKCYICNIIFAIRDELVAHLAANHAAQIDYVCKECDGKKFSMITTYNQHLSLHDETERPLKCNFCTVRYCTRQGLNSHENKEHGTNHFIRQATSKREKQQCEICGKRFTCLTQVREHKIAKHEKGIVAQCHICKKTFANYPNLKRHLITHSKESPFQCQICEDRFRVQTHLKEHIRTKHEGQEATVVPRRRISMYKCLLCNVKTHNGGLLNDHVDTAHVGEEYPYKQCPECQREFTSEFQLKMHRYYSHSVGVRTKKNLICGKCNKECTSTWMYDWHMVKEHGAERKHSCGTCGKRFITLVNLQRHEDIHKEIKRHKCDFCDKMFTQKNAMMNHRRSIHTKETPFQCKKCGALFKETSTYYRHRTACEENFLNETQ